MFTSLMWLDSRLQLLPGCRRGLCARHATQRYISPATKPRTSRHNMHLPSSTTGQFGLESKIAATCATSLMAHTWISSLAHLVGPLLDGTKAHSFTRDPWPHNITVSFTSSIATASPPSRLHVARRSLECWSKHTHNAGCWWWFSWRKAWIVGWACNGMAFRNTCWASMSQSKMLLSKLLDARIFPFGEKSTPWIGIRSPFSEHTCSSPSQSLGAHSEWYNSLCLLRQEAWVLSICEPWYHEMQSLCAAAPQLKP